MTSGSHLMAVVLFLNQDLLEHSNSFCSITMAVLKYVRSPNHMRSFIYLGGLTNFNRAIVIG